MTRAGYSPDRPHGIVLVRYAPGTSAVLAHEGVVIVVHAVSARPILAFPAGRVVIVVAGVVGHAVLAIAVAGGIAVNGGCGPAVATVAIVAAAGIAAAVTVVTSAEAGAGVGGGGVGRRRSAGRGRRRRRRARVQREKVLLQPHAHRITRVRVVTQGQNVEALLGLPDMQPKILGGAVLLRLIPTDGRIH